MSSVRTFLTVSLVGALVAFASCCSSGSKADPNDSAGDRSADRVATSDSPVAGNSYVDQVKHAQGMFYGRVVESMDAGGYTYVRLEKDEESVWAAGPQSSIAIGDEVGVSLAMVMNDFYSDTLERTFDSVYFVGGFEHETRAGKGGTASAHPGDVASADAFGAIDDSGFVSGDYGGSSRSVPPSADADISQIQKPEGGHTVAELWAASATLKDQPVVFRGKVVKYNTEILGRNWLHVQDGSGDPAQKNHDVTVTTTSSAQVGDIVTVRGTLAIDKDFGAGYKYPMIIEDASLDISL